MIMFSRLFGAVLQFCKNKDNQTVNQKSIKIRVLIVFQTNSTYRYSYRHANEINKNIV